MGFPRDRIRIRAYDGDDMMMIYGREFEFVPPDMTMTLDLLEID
jgi:hypothetical protein